MIGRSILVLLAAFTLPLTVVADYEAPPAESGMKPIFNGVDLTGWDGDPRLWYVANGVIRGETSLEKTTQGNTFLIWKQGITRDFELRLSFRVSTANNSGIQYRSRRIEENAPNGWVVDGYQHEIRNSVAMPEVAGYIYDEGGLAGNRRRICLVGEKAIWENGEKIIVDNLIDPEAYRELFNVDGWNDVVIVARGNHLRHYLNGRLILDFTDSAEAALSEGVLALQLHHGEPMWVEFRDIRFKALAEF